MKKQTGTLSAFRLILLFALLGMSTLAHGNVLTFSGALSGANENPPQAVPGTGTATVRWDDVANTIEIAVDFTGLTGPVTGAFIHCCVVPPGNAGVATAVPRFPGFPTTTSGSYDQTFSLLDPTLWNPAFVSAHTDIPTAAAFFTSGLAAGQTYLNLHTDAYPGGEIRAFLVAAPVPEPSSLLLLGSGLAGFAGMIRRKLNR